MGGRFWWSGFGRAGSATRRGAIDLWWKEIAPSTELRKWFNQNPDKWEEFRKRYWAELLANNELVAQLKQNIAAGTVTFVFASSDVEHNSAVALKEFLERRK